MDDKKIKWAMDYLNHGIKEGYFQLEDFMNMDIDEIVETLEKAADMSDNYYGNQENN
jgi:hypothetical protein